ncbi:MAG: putative glycoside hydrolase, partial [Elusimicrobia bacterium]|nr:putative glycoside hydrolase [Elusimicrobiota bacterium]
VSSWWFFTGTKKEKEPVRVEEKKEGGRKIHIIHKPKYVRGVHLSAWVAGSKRLREKINKLLKETEINSVVIAIKEYEGSVYAPDFKGKDEFKTFTNAIPDLKDYIEYLNDNDIYTIARIVVFKDNTIIKKRQDWAVKDKSGNVWKDHSGNTWADPYNREVWDYNLNIAEKALELGFSEIQFDYLRFPSDGNTRNCVYSQAHSSITASQALTGFLEEANKRLKSKGANISIDVFGLTTTSDDDMGIGQKIVDLAQWVDFVSPMVYPSHYAKFEYGIPDPNLDPYKTVYLSMNGALKRAPKEKLRPYLQDFSMGKRYGAKEVRDQIQATYDNDIGEWLLWNPKCDYTKEALKTKEFSNIFEKSPDLAEKTNFETKVSTETQIPVPITGLN